MWSLCGLWHKLYSNRSLIIEQWILDKLKKKPYQDLDTQINIRTENEVQPNDSKPFQVKELSIGWKVQPEGATTWPPTKIYVWYAIRMFVNAGRNGRIGSQQPAITLKNVWFQGILEKITLIFITQKGYPKNACDATTFEVRRRDDEFGLLV